MHELSIALSIVEGALEEGARRGAGRIKAVYLRLGQLSGVDKDALLFSYNVACQDTPMADSRLVIEEVEARIHCPVCGGEGAPRGFPRLVCAECGALAERLLRGDELQISALELAS